MFTVTIFLISTCLVIKNKVDEINVPLLILTIIADLVALNIIFGG